MKADQNNDILQQLSVREPIFHHPDKYGATKADLLELTDESFWEVGASGTIYTRNEVIEILIERYNNSDYIDKWETKDFAITEIAPNNFLLTYLLIQDDERVTRRATIWRRVNDKWKVLYHQGTIVSEDEL